MRVVAKKTVPYDGVWYKKGQEFDIEGRHFKVLSFINKVEKAPEPEPEPEPESEPKPKAAPRRRTTQNRAVKSDESDGESTSKPEEQTRGTYSRRDMKAED